MGGKNEDSEAFDFDHGSDAAGCIDLSSVDTCCMFRNITRGRNAPELVVVNRLGGNLSAANYRGAGLLLTEVFAEGHFSRPAVEERSCAASSPR